MERKGEGITSRSSDFSQDWGERSGAGEGEVAAQNFQAEGSIKAPVLTVIGQSCLIFMNFKLSIIILHEYCAIKYTETKTFILRL